MGVIIRGFKNAFRNNVRTVSVVFILALSIAMSLVMLLSLKTVQGRIESVKSSIGNTISVSPAGARGFEGGGEPLTSADISSISSLSHVTKVSQTVNDHLTPGTNTNLVPSQEAGTIGNRQRQQMGADDGSATARNQRVFAMPIMVTGTNDLTNTASLFVDSFTITSGEKFDGGSDQNVALVGSELATKNNLSVGSTFQAYGKDISVVGIFDGGSKFANANFVMPLKSLQILSGQADQVTSATVLADSIDNIAAVKDSIKSKLGAKADVTAQQDSSAEAVKPLENIKTISLYSLIGSLAAGAIVIFLTMLMIVRERRREIGVLKAIGSSNIGIVAMFNVESLVLTLTSSVVGIFMGLVFSNPILKVLVNNSEASGNASVASMGGPNHDHAAMMAGVAARALPGARNALNNLHAVVGWDILLYGLGAAVLIAIIGSAIPAFFISKVRPAEVMRAE
ncbi:MAG: FtsX-like permease family protein [Patescibacteria group bacterium]|jgi:putative ABC transport system permease protein